jgi:hypothetical protein
VGHKADRGSVVTATVVSLFLAACAASVPAEPVPPTPTLVPTEPMRILASAVAPTLTSTPVQPAPTATVTATVGITSTKTPVSSALHTPTATVTPAAAQLVVVAESLEVRLEPDTQSDLLGAFIQDTAVDVLGQSGGWFQVVWVGKGGDAVTGWVWGDIDSVQANEAAQGSPVVPR